MNIIPENPTVAHTHGDVFRLSEPVIVDGERHFYVKFSYGCEFYLGDENYNVFVCDSDGGVLDWVGLCHTNALFDGPPWLYDLSNMGD